MAINKIFPCFISDRTKENNFDYFVTYKMEHCKISRINGITSQRKITSQG